MDTVLRLADRLVAAVGRAFYNDTTVVILDLLTREPYVRDDEISGILKLSARDVSRSLAQLEGEMLIRSEEVMIEERPVKCYYIDYQTFVNSVRYRLHLMQQELEQQQTGSVGRLEYQCPNCRARCSNLEANMCVTRDYKRVCSNCCPADNPKSIDSQPWFRLVEVDNSEAQLRLQSMSVKLTAQMSEVPGLHDGIYELLDSIKREVAVAGATGLPVNRPSANVALAAKRKADREHSAALAAASATTVAPETANADLSLGLPGLAPSSGADFGPGSMGLSGGDAASAKDDIPFLRGISADGSGPVQLLNLQVQQSLQQNANELKGLAASSTAPVRDADEDEEEDDDMEWTS